MDRSKFNQSFFQFIGDTQKVAYDLTLALKPEGLSNKAFSVLEHLYYSNSSDIKQIALSLGISYGSARYFLKALLNDNLVKRQKKGRGYTYSLTKQGKVKLDACFFQVVNGIQNKYQSLDEETLGSLMECMHYITKKMY